MSDKPTAVRVYLARVRTALADLPASEIEEILEDVRPHLTEMEAELGEGARVEALIERLGTPESYAAELRASGGYPPPTEVISPGEPKKEKSGLGGPRFALWGLAYSVIGLGLFAFAAAVDLSPGPLLGLFLVLPVLAISAAYVLRHGVEPLDGLPEVKSFRTWWEGVREGQGGKALGYLRSLKPAWWIVCALVLVGFGLLLMMRRTEAALALPILFGVGVAVIWAGQKTRQDRRLWWLAIPVSGFVIGAMFGGFGSALRLVADRNAYSGSSSYQTTGDGWGGTSLTYGGHQIENVYAFDGEGKPLTEVYLYDERGNPISMTRWGCENSTGSKRKVGEDNRFPRPEIEQGVTDDQGNYNGYNGYRAACRENPGVPFSAAIPKVTTPTPTTTPAPTTTPTPSPTTTPTK